MQEWFSKFVQEWPVISGAPISFATAVIVVIVLVWAVINWYYSSVLSNKNAQIDLLQSRVADYQGKLKGASPAQAAGELQGLRDQLAETKKQLAALTNPPRDENSIYQRGKRIGVVAGVQVDAVQKRVVFARMTVTGDIDRAANLEFRNLVLLYLDADAYGSITTGLAVTTTYNNARLSIVGNRQD